MSYAVAFPTKASVTLDSVHALYNKVEGRDKLCKLVQYGSRLAAWHYLTSDADSPTGQRAKLLFKGMQSARKGMRLGKTINEFQKLRVALATFQRGDELMPAWRLAMEAVVRLSMGKFFYHDNQKFFNAIKLANLDTKTVNGRAGVPWFIAKTTSIFMHLADFWLLAKKEAGLLAKDEERRRRLADVGAVAKEAGSDGQVGDEAATAAAAAATAKAVQSLREKKFFCLLMVLKESCDATVASNSPYLRVAERLRGTKLSDGVLGVAGCLSASILLFKMFPGPNK
eukprot:g4989.t1